MIGPSRQLLDIFRLGYTSEHSQCSYDAEADGESSMFYIIPLLLEVPDNYKRRLAVETVAA